MNPIIQKTLGGLSKEYYVRQFLFGLIFPAILYFISSQGTADGMPASLILLCIVNAFLYPYSRFVYESVVGYILGDTVLFGSIFVVAITKYITMSICWAAAIFIAPVGLVYLYFYHTKQDTNKQSQSDA
ncbi:hypothetical protein [Marinomonas sp. 2405UD68-3]|uniref:hypothetical protein n=1 Tax=Marinomonas sp. 2405UD68-3 TaxID=3391835 RepID=UPI0039C9435E